MEQMRILFSNGQQGRGRPARVSPALESQPPPPPTPWNLAPYAVVRPPSPFRLPGFLCPKPALPFLSTPHFFPLPRSGWPPLPPPAPSPSQMCFPCFLSFSSPSFPPSRGRLARWLAAGSSDRSVRCRGTSVAAQSSKRFRFSHPATTKSRWFTGNPKGSQRFRSLGRFWRKGLLVGVWVFEGRKERRKEGSGRGRKDVCEFMGSMMGVAEWNGREWL